MSFIRDHATTLNSRLNDTPKFIVIVAGPRQIGKSTLVKQVLQSRKSTFVSVDQQDSDSLKDRTQGTQVLSQRVRGSEPSAEWLIDTWTKARKQARQLQQNEHFVLAVDEIQKIPRWSEIVKGLWEADRAENLNLHVVLLGSSPWLMQKGLTESLAGRFELIPMSHWSYTEMQEAFDFSLEEYIYFGGYPGAASLIKDETRWTNYIRSSLIHPNIEKDILQMTRIDKPALLKNLFELGCMYSGQMISYNKLLGQLQDAGNTTTLRDYLTLLGQAGLLAGIPKYAGQVHRQRGSSPKLNALNTGLMSALTGYTFAEARADRSYWGRLVESSVGAHIYNTAEDNTKVFYWRDGDNEVDFIIEGRRKMLAIEVKSGQKFAPPKGLDIFTQKFKAATPMIVGEGGIPLSEFLSRPASEWLEHNHD